MIYITGDTHIPIDIRKLTMSNFAEQKSLTKDDVVIVCGDFGGVWDNSGEELYWRKWLEDKSFTTLFIDGNHENFPLLNQFEVVEKFGANVHQIGDSIFHLMRGEIYTIHGLKFFCMGGASSHDKEYRVPYRSWWPEELPSREEMEHAIDVLDANEWSVDYIITHCAPKNIQRELADWYENDVLTSFLQIVNDQCNFKHWFFGHYHEDRDLDERHTALYQRIIPIAAGGDADAKEK